MATIQAKRTLNGLAVAQTLLATAALAALPAPAGAQGTATNEANAQYVACLSGLNTTVTGRVATGMATFTITGRQPDDRGGRERGAQVTSGTGSTCTASRMRGRRAARPGRRTRTPTASSI
jgi:hypothetical protein